MGASDSANNFIVLRRFQGIGKFAQKTGLAQVCGLPTLRHKTAQRWGTGVW